MKAYDLYKDGKVIAEGIRAPMISVITGKTKRQVQKRISDYGTLWDGYEVIESEYGKE